MLAESLPSMSARELLTTTHGMLFGGLFLLAFSGGMVSFLALGSGRSNARGSRDPLKLLRIWVLIQAIAAWAATLTGAFVIYPWYRAKPPAGGSLADYPQAFLMAHPTAAPWHSFGMEWKEHLAWFVPLLATCVAFLVTKGGHLLDENRQLRSIAMTLYSLAFAAAALAGILGAEITKAAPIH